MKDVKSKSQPVTKAMVWKAWLGLRANGQSPGVDGVSLQAFEANLSDNLYTLWNRMASGSYFPSPVKRVFIPKADGRNRPLGIPTITDRVAQKVVKDYLEPTIERVFSPNSFGYRPGRSAHQALEKARQMCGRYPWVIDLDIEGFFDTLDHELLMKALRKHTQEKWVLMYIERWLHAPVETSEGVLEPSLQGSPQGGVISPLLANLFLHYAFDRWMEIKHPSVEFERFADDIVVHCATKEEAEDLLKQIRHRLAQVNLSLHPEKTKVVYCKNGRRGQDHAQISFDFLGFSFRPRRSKTRKGLFFLGFDLGISNKAKKRIRAELRGLCLHRRTLSSLSELAALLNPKLSGWWRYYGKFRPYLMRVLWESVNEHLLKWVGKRYKRFKRSTRRSRAWLKEVYRENKTLFVHWQLGAEP
jgi:group II intron reverse transcriptase/maturase